MRPMPPWPPSSAPRCITARDRIAAYHQRQMPKDDRYTDALGVELGTRWTALDAVGLYVPGGTAAYPSSVLMNAVPAKVAGVERIVMTVPTPPGVTSPLVLSAARLAGIDEIYRVGGAQAVAALAYGTETIRPVAKIVGPGNAYVAAAKRLVFGHVGIDMIAGPSDVPVIADDEQRSRLDRRRPARPGRARRGRAGDPDHALRRTRRPCRGRRRGPAQGAAARRHRRRELARSRRDHRRGLARRGRGARQPHRAGASRTRRRRPGGAAAACTQCRRRLPRPPHARGHRRLCRRPQPRPADGRARRASPPACRCSTSSSAPRS